MMHLRNYGVECKLCDLSTGQVFLRTEESEVQDTLPAVTDGEPTTLKKAQHREDIHVPTHSHTHYTFTLHYKDLWNQVNFK